MSRTEDAEGPETGAVVVVPCFNEERRLAADEFLPLLARPGVELLFVNDGSTDGTEALLRAICAKAGPRVGVLSLDRNRGKAEAVRRGMLRALEGGAKVVGYVDADASTPGTEVARLLDQMRARGAAVVMGARVALLGTDIRRKRSRHYLGRVFASVASLLLELPVYDTQCGAKFFRDVPALRAALAEPFASRWVFDVELIGRLLTGAPGAPPLSREDFVEVPLQRWRDVAGSKLRPTAMLRSGLELVAIGGVLRRKRRSPA